MKKVLKKVLKVLLVDIHALTAEHPEWFAKDGVHPSNEGAAAIAQEIYSTLIGK